MTVLVTGATGFLGSHLTDLLLDRGEKTRVLVCPGDSPNRLASTGVEVVWGDLTDRSALKAALSGVDRVLHCAARTGPWGPEAEYERVNVEGLQVLLDAAMDAGIQCFVHVSSIIVHGNDVDGTADETAPFRVEPNPYSRSKVAGERLLERMIREQGAPVTIVRPGLIYGPRDAASFGRFARMIRQGRMIMVGSGNNHLPLIYVRDVAQGVLLASNTNRAIGRSYLLINDEPVTQSDYLSAIAAELGIQPPKRRLPYRLALALGGMMETAARVIDAQEPPPVTRFGLQLLGGENRFNISRAREELGFSPQVMLAEGVKRSVAWYLMKDTLAAPSQDLKTWRY